MNTDWYLCTKGKQQSPINIDPRELLFDMTLTPIKVEGGRVDGVLSNTGHFIRFLVNDTFNRELTVSRGPLTYTYSITDYIIHFGGFDSMGSEHTIDGHSFPGEIQIMAYNSDLYSNFSMAVNSPHGLASISILVQIGTVPNREIESLATAFKQIKYQGLAVPISQFSIPDLLPNTPHYMTYDGSLTAPGCEETVTWIIINKPLYVTDEIMSIFRSLMRGTEDTPRGLMENNFRPTQRHEGRSVRTNVNVGKSSPLCSVKKETYYQANVPGRN
ncbi:putative carbonic anhydrase-like protein 2 isoform X2 [Tubulanus polymorphus]